MLALAGCDCLYNKCAPSSISPRTQRLALLLAGVEHLLRNVKDATVSTLSTEVSRMATGLRGLQARLTEIQSYLALVLERKIPVNHDIIYQLQVPGPQGACVLGQSLVQDETQAAARAA